MYSIRYVVLSELLPTNNLTKCNVMWACVIHCLFMLPFRYKHYDLDIAKNMSCVRGFLCTYQTDDYDKMHTSILNQF